MSGANSIISNRRSLSAPDSWRRVDIFWSDADRNKWDTKRYYAPHYSLIEKEGILQRANAALNLRKDRGKATSQVVEYAQKSNNIPEFEGSSRIPIDEMLKEAARIHAKGKSNTVICTQVSQWIIIQVKTYKPIIDGDYTTFPNIHVWGFLQPASIGGDRKRLEKEKGWVTDDIPRAGWYEAKIVWSRKHGGENNKVNGQTPAYERYKPEPDGKKIFVEGIYCSNRDKNHVREKINYRLIENEDGTCNTIQIKVKAVIRNDETKEDRERKAASMKQEIAKNLSDKGKDKDSINKIISSIDRYEAGSYLKIWVRNLDYCWSPPPMAGDVADDESERCMKTMFTVDSPGENGKGFIFENYNNTPSLDKEDICFRPYSFRNHTWKRNKIVVNPWGENTGSVDSYRQELVYILLLPTEVLEKIDKLFTDEQVASIAKDPQHTWILQLSTCIAYFVLLAFLRKIKEGQNDKKKFQSLIDALALPKHAAILASMGPVHDKESFKKSFQNKKLHEVFKGKDLSDQHFFDKEQRLCQFFAVVFKQAYAIALTGSDTEYASFVEEYEERQNSFWNSNNSKNINRTLGFGESDGKLVNIDYVFREAMKTKELCGSNLPGYFAWLEWAVILKLGFALAAQVSFGKKKTGKDQEEYFLNGSLDPMGIISLAVELGAVWSMMDKEKLDADFPEAWKWADTVKYVLTWVELKLGISLSLKSEGKIGFDVNFLSAMQEKIQAIFNPFLKIDHTLSLDSQIYATVSNLAQIDYSALHYQIMHLTGSGISIGDKLFIGGKPVAGLKPFSFIWGNVHAHEGKAYFSKKHVLLGQKVSVYANYRGQPDPSHYSLDLCIKEKSLSSENYKWVLPVFSEEIKRERNDTKGEMPEYPDKIIITNEMTISSEFFTDPIRKEFLKNLLSGDQKIAGIIYLNDEQYKDDEITKAKTEETDDYCTIITPYAGISLSKDEFNLDETITAAVVIYNFACEIPVYLWVYEDDDYCVYREGGNLDCMVINSLKVNGNNYTGYVKIPLDKFKIMSNVRNELLYRMPLLSKKANVSFRLSLDPDGEFMLKSKNSQGKLVDTTFVKDISVE